MSSRVWQPEGTIKSKTLPIEIAINDYWEASDDKESSMVIDGKKRYFTWAEAMAIKAEGWRLPTRAEWVILYGEFGNDNGDISTKKFSNALSLMENGYIFSHTLWNPEVCGNYWSSTARSDGRAYLLRYRSGYVEPSYYSKASSGLSVRLVRDIKE